MKLLAARSSEKAEEEKEEEAEEEDKDRRQRKSRWRNKEKKKEVARLVAIGSSRCAASVIRVLSELSFKSPHTYVAHTRT